MKSRREQEQLEEEIKDVRDQNSKLQIQVNQSSVEAVEQAQQKQEELEAEGKRMRSTKMPRRRAQERALEELRAINPVLASPQDFIPSLKR